MMQPECGELPLRLVLFATQYRRSSAREENIPERLYQR
jgi:hypothetical protein